MRSLARALALGLPLICFLSPARAQEEEETTPPAAEKAAVPSEPVPSEPVVEEPGSLEATDETPDETANQAPDEARPKPRKRRRGRRRARVPTPAEAHATAAAEAAPASLPTGEQEPGEKAADQKATGQQAAEEKVNALADEMKALEHAAPAEAIPPSGKPTEAAAAHTEQPVTGETAAPSEPAASPAPQAAPAAVPPVHGEHPDRPADHEAHAPADHGEAHGAGHGEHARFSVSTFIFQLLNFGVLLFLLIRFGGRAMNKALRAKHDQLKGDIDESTRLRVEAQRKFDAQEKRIADLEKEIATLRESMRKVAAREHARLIQSAEERAKHIQDDMRSQIDEQVKVAEAELRAEAANAAVKLAEEIARSAVNFEDERRLAREFVASFDASAEAGSDAGKEVR